MPRLVHITTVPDSLGFIEGQILFMQARGFDVTVITSPGPKLDDFVARTGVQAFEVPMHRAITPGKDKQSLMALVDTLLDLDPDIVHAHTPKGGLLGMIAATIALVPVKIYHMRGLLTFTATGMKRELFRWAERTSCALADHVIAQSHSLRDVAIEESLVTAKKISVFHGGSNGVDATRRFNPYADAQLPDQRSALGIPKTAPVIGFVGRLVKDKGIEELLVAWKILNQTYANPHLIIVGPVESRDALAAETVTALEDDPNVHLVGYTRETPAYYAAMDVVTLPSYREGFPNVPLEAAAMEIPVVTTDVPGCTDAVVHGETGLVVPVRNGRALADALKTYLESPDLRHQHGVAARARVLKDFDPAKIWDANLNLYQTMLERHARRD